MPINRYQIRNVYSLADPKLYKASDKDDPEALLEGVAMAGLVGVLRQLGDLAEFAAEIFHDLHEGVMATAARGHGLLVRIQQLESEIPPIERAFLSQTSHSAFFLNSGAHWHPNQRTTQNLITTGDLPRFVRDSYEECRGPPRLFLLDKFDVGGAGACLKRYTDPSIFKVEVSSDEVEFAETQREKKIRQAKKKGSRWKGGETPEVSQSSHAKLHQLFLEERVQTDATEAARRVKLKKRRNKFPLGSESGESYMNKLLDSASCAHEIAPAPSHGSRLVDGGIMGSALGSPIKNTRPCVSSTKNAENQPSYDDDLEVDDNQTTVDNEICSDGLQNAYPSEDVASETDSYMDARVTTESEVETSITQRTYSDANKHQLQSQSDSQFVENSTVSNDGNNSITKGMSVSGNSDTTSTSSENASPVGADSSSQPFACVEIPFHPRVTPITDNISVTHNPSHDITDDTCIDVSKVSDVDQVASLEEGTLDTNEVCSDHTERLDTSRKSDDHQIDTKDTAKCTSEHSDLLPVADGLSSFSVAKYLKGDLEYKYPNDSSIPMNLLPNILETTKNQTGYDLEIHSTDSVVSSSQSVISRVDELSSDTTFNDNNSVTEEQIKEKGEGVLVISDQAEARVSFSSGHETESHDSEIEPVTVADANTNHIADSALKEGTGTESVERETESTYSDDKRDDCKGLGDDLKLERIDTESVSSDMETRCAVFPVDVDRHDENGHSVSEQDSKKSGEKEEVNSPLSNSKIVQNHNHSFLAETNQNQEIVLPDLGSQPVSIEPCVSNAQLIDNGHEATAFTESDDDIESKSRSQIDLLEEKVDQSNYQLCMQLPLETKGSQLGSLTQVDHETLIETQLQDSESFSESVLVSEKPPTVELSSHDIISYQDDIVAPCHDESHVFTEADHALESKSLNHGDHVDVYEVPAPAQLSLVEDKVDQPIDQLHVPVLEKLSTMELSTHDINLSDQVKHQSSPVFSAINILPQLPPVKVEDPPPMPPLPPMQWRMRKLQRPLSTPTNGGQHNENQFPPVFSSTSIQNPEVVGQSTIDETIDLDRENQKSPTQYNEVKYTETLVPQAAAVDPHRMATVSYQEVFWPSSSPYPLAPVLDEMQINVRPMKIQRPRSPLIDAVAAHDKTKLRKVSDRDIIHIPKGGQKDTLLDQIRAKSINLKPAVLARPSIQGPTTNLRVAAILEKANAIRHAFAGSDDDDSDNWSDS